MKLLALLAAPLLFGCATAKPVPVAAPEKDPWADFKGDESRSIPPVAPPGTETAKVAARLADGAKANGTETSTTAAPRKKARHAPVPVGGKKSRKRAKHSS